MKKKILIIISILTLIFIWGQSMLPKGQSANESGFIMDLVRPFLEIFVGKGNVTDHLVRKVAHFVEYSVLGVEFALFLVAGWIANAKCNAKEGSTLIAEIMSLSIWGLARSLDYYLLLRWQL